MDRPYDRPRVEGARYELSDDDRAAIDVQINRAVAIFDSVEAEDFLSEVILFAQELPRPLRQFLNAYRLGDGHPAYCVLSGFCIDDRTLGPTPPHWDTEQTNSPTLREEMYLMLCAALVGDVFGWATQQGGAMVHDVLPIKAHEMGQMGVSSGTVLAWHTEDAFHPFRADHVGLMCLRNPDQTATTVGTLDLSELTAIEVETLFEPRFIIRSDPSHQPEYGSHSGESRGVDATALAASYEALSEADEAPSMIPVLSGRRTDPFICADPIYSDVRPGDNAGAAALEAFGRAIDRRLTDVVLEPGDVLLVDNSKAVHGRQTFDARYDGTDRWLKRVNITPDLRKSAASRTAELSRLIC